MINEFVWRNLSEAAWVNFKFGMLPLTLVFAMAQIGLIRRYEIRATPGADVRSYARMHELRST